MAASSGRKAETMRQVAILHGWSDESDSFKPLAEFLRAQGRDTVSIWLGDYISMEDDVSIEDVGKRMQAVVTELQAKGELDATFDLIVHSTGGLVAREWLSSYFGTADSLPPVKRLVMLAPANYGSRLARTGKTFLGRVFKGGFKNHFSTGTRMLNALELGSAFQWKLVAKDMLVPPDVQDDGFRIYGEKRVLPFVIVGSRGYHDFPRSIVDEDGSDGTVRVSAANLNVYGATIDLSLPTAERGPPEEWIQPWTQRFAEPIPLAVLPDRHHSSVINPGVDDDGADLGVPAQLGVLILQALNCAGLADYRSLQSQWAAVSDGTANIRNQSMQDGVLKNGAKPDEYHQYVQVNVQVVDDHGDGVGDYMIEFSSNPAMSLDDATAYFQQEVLKRVDVNSVNPASRTLYLDFTDWIGKYYQRSQEKRLLMRLSAAQLGKNIAYFTKPDGETFSGSEQIASPDLIQVDHGTEAGRWIRPNTTHFVKFIVPRLPADRVFRLTKFNG